MPTGRSLALGLGAATLLLVAGCGGDAQGGSQPSASSGRPVVVTDMYPTTFAVEQVAGDSVQIVQLAPTGVEPHEYELSPRQVQQIADADLVAYLPGMIPAVSDAVAQEASDKAVDVSAGITRLETGHADEHDSPGASTGDPHVWLDPANMTTMGTNMAKALTSIGVPADSTGLTAQMSTLDAEMSAALAHCAVTTMVVSHEAFGYLAHAYGFTQVGITGLSPEAEPSAARMAEITHLVESEGITTVYFESLVSPDAARAIAAETGVPVALLDPIESNTDGKGYPAIMRANRDTLKTGQSCL
jgi:zinc transport system substrate-binding protein